MIKNVKLLLIVVLTIIMLCTSCTSVFAAVRYFPKSPGITNTKPVIESEDTFNEAFSTYKKTVMKKLIVSKAANLLPEWLRGTAYKFAGLDPKDPTYDIKDMCVEYIDVFFMPYIGGATGDSPEVLAQVVTDITKEDWSGNTIKTALWRLIDRISKTTNGIPTKEDVNELIEKLTNGETYYPDLPINGREYTYSTIQDIARICNFSNMLVNYPAPIIYYDPTENTDANGNVKNKVYMTEPTDGKKHASVANPNKEGKPITIIEGVELYKEGEKETVYLIALAGTGFINGQSSGLIADVLSGCESNSPYLQKALEAINTIPKGSKIVIAGFSLGGMIAQQVMVQPSIYNNYDIIQVVILGSPALNVEERKGLSEKLGGDTTRINRVLDKNDLIPSLCTEYLRDEEPSEIFENLHVEECKQPGTTETYKTFIGTHFIGYLESEVYTKYDVLGFRSDEDDHGWKMKVNYDNAKYYSAPNWFVPDKLSALE